MTTICLRNKAWLRKDTLEIWKHYENFHQFLTPPASVWGLERKFLSYHPENTKLLQSIASPPAPAYSHDSDRIVYPDLNVRMESSKDLIVSQTEDAQWRLETLKGPEHQAEAHRRLEYLTLMPKLALFCILSDWLYLGCRILLVTKAPSVERSAYVVLSIEICFAGKSPWLGEKDANFYKLWLDFCIYNRCLPGVKPSFSFLPGCAVNIYRRSTSSSHVAVKNWR